MSDPTSNSPDASPPANLAEAKRIAARRAFLRGAVPLVVTLTVPGIANAVSTPCSVRFQDAFNSSGGSFPKLTNYLNSQGGGTIGQFVTGTQSGSNAFPSYNDANGPVQGEIISNGFSQTCLLSAGLAMNGTGNSTAFV